MQSGFRPGSLAHELNRGRDPINPWNGKKNIFLKKTFRRSRFPSLFRFTWGSGTQDSRTLAEEKRTIRASDDRREGAAACDKPGMLARLGFLSCSLPYLSPISSMIQDVGSPSPPHNHEVFLAPRTRLPPCPPSPLSVASRYRLLSCLPSGHSARSLQGKKKKKKKWGVWAHLILQQNVACFFWNHGAGHGLV